MDFMRANIPLSAILFCVDFLLLLLKFLFETNLLAQKDVKVKKGRSTCLRENTDFSKVKIGKQRYIDKQARQFSRENRLEQ